MRVEVRARSPMSASPRPVAPGPCDGATI